MFARTKRSVARDKYSGNHEELLEAGEMAAPKPSMMSLSMTSSVQSDNHQAQGTRSRAPVPPGSRGKPETRPAVSQNQVNLYMTHDEDPPSSPPPPSDGAPLRRSRRKQPESCCEIDDAMERLRHNGSGDGFRLAKLDCMEAPALQPARHRKTTGKRDKIGAGDKDIRLPNLPQVTMTFDELNGLIKRKGGTPICNMEMEDQEKHHHSSTSLVRQAHRRTRTRENPNLELRALQQGSVMSKDVQFASLDSSLVPLQRKQRKVVHSGSEEDSPRAEIQIKMEATTMRTVCRPTKRPAVHGGQLISNPEPLRALPMPELKQSLEAINKSMGQAVLPRLKLGNEREDLESDADEQDNYTSELDDEPEEEDDLIARATKLIERARSCPSPKPNPSAEDTHSGDEEQEEEEEQPDLELEKVLKLPPLTKQNSNVSRRLVVLEQDENGTMYIKSATSSQRRANRSEAKAPEERLQRQRSNASNASSQEEKQSRQDMEKRMGAEDQQKREIFISIETEANAQGRSPISPDSLRHMVGNAQTPIDVLHIENGNEPEHARFSKISDTEDAGDESGDRTSQATATGRLAPSPSGSALAPNVQLNNAKNLIQQMQSDFRQLGEEASASMRRMLIVSGRGDEQQQQQQQASREVRDPNPIPNLEQEQQHIKANAPLTPSPSAESDELSSLDGYPMSSSHGSRRGASSKMSTDSAYGSSNSPYSLSRQRSSELQPVASHSQGLQRPHTASAMLAGGLTDSSPQTHSAHGGLKARKRLFVPESGSNGDGAELSISGPDHFLQQHQQISNYNYQQLQQQQLQQQQQQLQQQQPQQQQEKPLPQSLQDYNANNNLPITPTISEHSLNSNESMSSSMRISKYCHECGGKFILDTAKFCMECGMKRIIF
ncbi:AF4/FMR2 family member lilli isoform X5 [Drosophila ficusphila]|uniref:AF4/FMR2 family member lilli isoform X5 n=1 Tax=Drosophila ficusphila TaxID=30025 RepID=UPI001C8AE579|nr:AF4/FMR2 family member lilli isoform X5 [Drosophila ficusphila]